MVQNAHFLLHSPHSFLQYTTIFFPLQFFSSVIMQQPQHLFLCKIAKSCRALRKNKTALVFFTVCMIYFNRQLNTCHLHLQERCNIVKIRTKSFLTVLFTFLSLCVASLLLVCLVITPGSSAAAGVISGIIVSFALSVAAILIRKQPKSVLMSFSLTVCIAWSVAPLLYYVLVPLFSSASVSVLKEIFTVFFAVISFPAFMFAMAFSENIASFPFYLYFVIFALCGLLPVAVTFLGRRLYLAKNDV